MADIDISSLFSKKFNMDKFSKGLSAPANETYEEMMRRLQQETAVSTAPVKHVFEPPVDTSKNMNPNDLFKTLPKPKPYTTFHKGFVQESADNVSSIGTKLGSGISEVMRGLSSVTDLQSRGLSNAVGLIANPIIQLFGGSKVDFNKSITQHAIGVAHDFGLKPIDTSNIKDSNIKAMAEAVNQENNPTAAYWRRIGSAMDVTSEQLKPKIGAVAKFTGDIARSTPQMAAYAVSGGAAAIGQYANAVEDLYASDVKPTTKQVGEAIMQANIDVGTEMIFDLFGNINGLIKNSLKIQGTTAVGKALAPTAGMATLSALKAAGGEGVEELIAYPLQQITTWLYQNEDKPLSDYFKEQNLKDWGYAGLVGASMGLIVGSYQAVKSPKVSASERKEIETLATELFNTPITKLTEAQATKLLEKIAEPLKAMSKAPTETEPSNRANVESAQNSSEVLSHRLDIITKSKQDLIAQMTEEDDVETIADYNIKLQEISNTEAEVRQKLQTAKPYESITQKVNKSSNVGYHAGNLGKAEHLSNMTGGRGTGHFGTGTYFVGSKNIIDKSDSYALRPINEIDFDGYNLYKPKTKNEGVQLHEALKFINNKLQYDASNITSNDDISNYSDSVNDALSDWEETISESDPYGDKTKLNQLTSLLSRFYNEQSIEHELSRFDKPWQAYESLVKGIERKVSDTQYNREYFEEHINNLSKLLGVDSLKIKSILDSAIKKYSPIIKDGVLGNKIDSISTLLMKKLGYEGVDVRGLDGLDNFEFGSVIYDLKKESKSFEEHITTIAADAKTDAEITARINQTIDNPESASVKKLVDEYKATFNTEEKIVAEIARLKKELDSLPKSNTEKEFEYKYQFTGKLGKINLQLLAMKSLISRTADVPNGSRVHSYIESFLGAIAKNKNISKELLDEINSSIPEEDLIYAQIGNKASLDLSEKRIRESSVKDGKNAYQERLAQNLIKHPDRILNPDENISLSKYIFDMMRSGTEEQKLRGEHLLSILANNMTAAGRSTQIVRAMKNLLPEYKAQALIHELKKQTSDAVDDAKLTQKQRQTNEITDSFRKENAIESIKETLDTDTNASDNAVVDTLETEKTKEKSKSSKETPEKAKKKEPLEPDAILVALINNDLKPKTQSERSDLQKMITTLYNIYKETNPSEPKQTDAFKAITEMVTKRAQYAEVWDKAKTEIERLHNNHPILAEYFERLADPTMTNRIMNQVIRQTLKRMDSTIQEQAQKYFLSGSESMNGFMETLRGELGTIDDASFEYLKKHITKRFIERMEANKAQLVRRLDALDQRKTNTNKRKSDHQSIINGLTKATIADKFDSDAVRRTWANRLNIYELSDEMIDDIKLSMQAISEMQTDEQKNAVYNEMIVRIANQIPARFSEKMQAWRRFSMLMNPASWMKNGISNIATKPAYYMSDRVKNILDTLVGVNAEDRFAGSQYIHKGVNKDIDAVVENLASPAKMKLMLDASAKYAIGTRIGAERKIFKNKTVEYLTKIPLNVMSEGKLSQKSTKSMPFLGDKFMFEKHFRGALANKLNALGYKASLSAEIKQEMVNEALAHAQEIASTRTYRHMTSLASRLMGLKNDGKMMAKMNELASDPATLARAEMMRSGIRLYNTAVDLMLPFVTTPAAIAVEGYKFSPFALASALIQVGAVNVSAMRTGQKVSSQQKSILTQKIAQATVGTVGQFVVGLVASALGVLTGSAPDSEKEKKEWELAGKKPYSIYLEGVGSLSIDWLQPLSMGLISGAEFNRVIAEKGMNFPALGEAFVASLDGLLAGSILDNLRRQIGRNSITEVATNVGTSGLFQNFPTMFKRLANSIDTYTRDTFSGNTTEIMMNRALSYFPAASMAQPLKIDVWGKPVESEDLGLGVLGRSVINLLSPFTVTSAKADAVSLEVARLFDATGKTDALPVIASDSFSKTDKGVQTTYTMTPAQYVQYQQTMGQTAYKMAQAIIATPEYRAMTDEQKIKKLKKAYSYASDTAKEQFILANRP